MIVEWVKDRWRSVPGVQLTRRAGSGHHPLRLSAFATRYPGVAALVLAALFSVYLLLGAAAFFFLERNSHERSQGQFQFSLALNRQQSARQISATVFNDTKNMFVIIDNTHRKRIHEHLLTFLKDYEQKFSQIQNRKRLAPSLLYSGTSGSLLPETGKNLYETTTEEAQWTLWSSFNYALALLTTIGHGTRAPHTVKGQNCLRYMHNLPRPVLGELRIHFKWFAMIYCLLGVPFYAWILLLITQRLFNTLTYRIFTSTHAGCASAAITNDHQNDRRRECFILALVGAYALWLAVFALVLHATVIREDVSSALFTAVFISLTIQTHRYNDFGDAAKTATLAGVAVSALILFLILRFAVDLYSGAQHTRHGCRRGSSGVMVLPHQHHHYVPTAPLEAPPKPPISRPMATGGGYIPADQYANGSGALPAPSPPHLRNGAAATVVLSDKTNGAGSLVITSAAPQLPTIGYVAEPQPTPVAPPRFQPSSDTESLPAKR